MSFGCKDSIFTKSFFTKDEKIELLREYYRDLRKAVLGLKEKIKELELN